MPDTLPDPLVVNSRTADASVDPQFLDRWSPRAFSPEPLDEATIMSLFEAARWAPSSGNEQPWIYLYATVPEERARFLDILDESNRIWVKHAPMIAFVVARLTLARNGKPNRTARFDAGSSWLSLALEARKLGLYAHAMAGFDLNKAYDSLNVPRDGYEVMAAIAIGKYGDPSQLDERNRGREKPSGRRHVSEFVFRGQLPTLTSDSTQSPHDSDA
ncbi:MAG: nitroreductase family protein [Gemmatimonadaceae bacterium]|nr:nitroreductase family protein [Gemmatimonadaceae bacterium]